MDYMRRSYQADNFPDFLAACHTMSHLTRAMSLLNCGTVRAQAHFCTPFLLRSVAFCIILGRLRQRDEHLGECPSLANHQSQRRSEDCLCVRPFITLQLYIMSSQ